MNKCYSLLHIFNNRQMYEEKNNIPSRRSHVLYNSYFPDHQITWLLLMVISYLSTPPCNTYEPAFIPSVSLSRFWITALTPFLTQPKIRPNFASQPSVFSTSATITNKKKLNKINITKLYIDNVSILIIHLVILFKYLNISICLFQNFHTGSLSKKLTGISSKCKILF